MAKGEKMSTGREDLVKAIAIRGDVVIVAPHETT
jgi:hypothetical protein